MNNKQLLKQALDALKLQQGGLQWYRNELPEVVDGIDDETDEQTDAAIEALRAAIAQPKSEPVAWMDSDGNISDNNDHGCFPIPLYTAPVGYVPLSDSVKQDLVTDWFAEGWAIEAAYSLLDDYDEAVEKAVRNKT